MLEPNYSLFTCLKPHIYIIQIDYHHCIHPIKIGSLNSKSNNRNYSVNNTREACQLNLYPITNDTNYKFQCIVWPFWSPYICKPHFTIYTIYLTNRFALGQSCEIIQWLFNAFWQNFWNSQWNSTPWSMTTLVGAPKMLNTLSINAQVVLSLLWPNNGTNFSHFEKCLIIIKTHWFVTLSNSMGHQNPNSTNNQTPWWAITIYEMYV